MPKQEVKRERGRPANFPDQEVIARLYKLPVATVELIEAEADRRGSDGRREPLGITLNRLIERGFKEFNRKRGK